ncbi:bacteriochlorophyll 4-vinyl reductase [Lentisalinibacter salinarum]|uniref:bacteriochlorophyll 4-vinyl reductase n=1 Tax=Lentisalinibacter salinarum TaxID=2992239 RepID=UPI0038644A1D
MLSIPLSRPAEAKADATAPGAMIGPNAVLQTLRAIAELEGTACYEAVARGAALPATDPDHMIPEALFMRLIESLRRTLPWARSEAVLRLAGDYTADYVAANRIPRFFRRLLHALPPRLALPLLLAAFRRHAWTFAGGGRFHTAGGYPADIVLKNCPTCRNAPEATAAGAYYEAAFQGLLRLAAEHATVHETACEACGDDCCRFSIDIEGARARGEKPCVSC